MLKIILARKFVILLLVLLVAAGLGYFSRQSEVSLPKYGAIGDFKFIDQNSEERSIKNYSGKVLLLNFFFTSCGGICPNIMGKLARVQQDFADSENFALVSISVDPKRDTIEQLKKYEKHLKANQSAVAFWSLGRAEQEQVLNFLRTGAKLVGDKNPDKHSTRVVLIDSTGLVRAYFDGLAPDLVDQLRPPLSQLLAD